MIPKGRDDMNFSEKVAVVTGAASGMGLLFCQSFTELGGSVVMADIDPQAVQRCADAICETHAGRAVAVACDVRCYEQVEVVRDRAVEAFGRIDVLVCFAGGAETRICHASGEFPDIPISVYDWGIDVNLKGQFYFAHAVLKQMREQKSGVIVNIGSITGEEGCEYNVAYATSKSGIMNGFTKSLAQYGARYGIRCCCVSPGPVLTRPGMAAMKTALGRAADPSEIVNLILYVASDEGAFLDGVNILMDGGRNILRNKQ